MQRPVSCYEIFTTRVRTGLWDRRGTYPNGFEYTFLLLPHCTRQHSYFFPKINLSYKQLLKFLRGGGFFFSSLPLSPDSLALVYVSPKGENTVSTPNA